MTLIDLQGKVLYSGDKEVKKAYLGGNVFYSLRQKSIEPYAYKPTGMLYAYDFTQGSTEPYSTSNDAISFKPVIFNSGTPVYTGTSMNLSAGSLGHDVTVPSSANTKSFYCSVTFDTVSARTGILFFMSMASGHVRIEKQVSGSNITFMARVQGSGSAGEDKVSPIITTPQTTLDFYIVSGSSTKLWVNGQPVGTISRTTALNGASSDPYIYGPINIYDYKVYLNPSSTPFTDAIILQQYQNIQQRLQTI